MIRRCCHTYSIINSYSETNNSTRLIDLIVSSSCPPVIYIVVPL